jgi:hypothetical protein
MRVGLPAALTNLIIPFAAAIVTSVLAPIGPEAVAGLVKNRRSSGKQHPHSCAYDIDARSE